MTTECLRLRVTCSLRVQIFIDIMGVNMESNRVKVRSNVIRYQLLILVKFKSNKAYKTVSGKFQAGG